MNMRLWSLARLIVEELLIEGRVKARKMKWEGLAALGGDNDDHPNVSFTINLVGLMMNMCSFVQN